MALIGRAASARAALCLALGAFGATGMASAQTAEHLAAAKAALEKSPVRSGNCAPVTEDFLGWPAALVQRCEYKVGETPAVAYVLDIKPETLANWVETACKSEMPAVGACFDLQFRCAAAKTGATFVVGGNLLMTRKGATTNSFYRNGVVIASPHNGTPAAVPLEEQEKLAHLPEAQIEAMPNRGGVALWDTMPYDFAAKAIELGVPGEMNEPGRRQKWLEVIRAEMQTAMTKPESRFLASWIHAHPVTLRVNECPERSDP